jgi:hypothetical protein
VIRNSYVPNSNTINSFVVLYKFLIKVQLRFNNGSRYIIAFPVSTSNAAHEVISVIGADLNQERRWASTDNPFEIDLLRRSLIK